MARGQVNEQISQEEIFNRIFDPVTNRITVDTELLVSGIDLQIGGIYIENCRVATDSSDNPQALLVDGDRHLQADSQILDSNRNPFTSTKHGDRRLLDVFVHSGASIEIYGEDSDGADRIVRTNPQGELQVDAQIQDSNGANFTSTPFGDHRLVDVFVHSGINVEVDFSHDEDSVQIYGNDGSSNQAIKTDTQGELQVDSQLLDSNDGKITSTDVGNHKAVDVFIQSGIELEVDLDHETDSVQIYGEDGSGTHRPVETDEAGHLQVHVISGISIVSGKDNNGVIREINTNAQGELETDSQIQDSNEGKFTSTDVGGHKALDVFVQSGIELEVNLNESGDSVQVYGNDGASNQAIKTDSQGELQTDSQIQDSNEGKFTSTDVGDHKALDVFVQSGVTLSVDASAKKSMLVQALGIGKTATAMPAAPLSDRIAMEIYNNSGTTLFIGHDTNVTAWNSAPLDVGGSVKYDLKDNVDVYGIQPAGPHSGNNDVRLTELA